MQTDNGNSNTNFVVCLLQPKLQVLEWLDRGESVQKLFLELGVGSPQLKTGGKTKRNSNHIQWQLGEKGLGNLKMIQKMKSELVDNVLWLWFCQEQRKGMLLSRPLIK